MIVHPTFEEWCEGEGKDIVILTTSFRTKQQLHEDIFIKDEASIIEYEGEKIRYGKVVLIDIFYYETTRKITYKLKEQRYRVDSRKTNDEIKKIMIGDRKELIESEPRPEKASISERVKLNSESIDEAFIRATYEEMFESDTPKSIERALKRIIQKNLQVMSDQPQRTLRGSTQSGNSYKGLKSMLDEYQATLTFTSNMWVPIRRDKNQVPQSVFEYNSLKGYLNIYDWIEQS